MRPQVAVSNRLIELFVPGRDVRSTGTLRGSLLALPYIGVPLEPVGYHSNDTAASCQHPAATAAAGSAPTKDASSLAQLIDRVLPRLL